MYLTLALTVTIALGLLFAASALHKLRDFRGHLEAVRDYRIMPTVLAPIAGIAVLALEISVPFLMFWKLSAALGVAASLLAVYAIAIAINLLRGRVNIDCGCLAPHVAGARIHWGMPLRNVVMASFALGAAFVLQSKTLSLIFQFAWLDYVNVVAALCGLSILYWAVEYIGAFESRSVRP